MKFRLKIALKNFVARFGVGFTKGVLDFPTLYNLFYHLKKDGIEIEVVYDIGAFQGNWAKEVKALQKKASLYLFEANPACSPHLTSTGFPFFIRLLGSETRRVKFYSRNETGDSIFPQYEETGTQRKDFTYLEMHPLDSVVTEFDLPSPDMIKIDAQGSELEILKGCQQTLQSAKVVLLECPILSINFGSPKLEEYLDFMITRNFVPYFLSQVHVWHGILVEIDIAFVRKELFEELVHPLDKVGFWKALSKERDEG